MKQNIGRRQTVYMRRWRKNNPDKDKAWARNNPRKVFAAQLKTKYGITLEFFDAMVREQAGRCAICSEPMRGPKAPCVDHDHETEDVRELLCAKCNRALGFFRDSPELLLRARDYLLRHKRDR